MYMHTDTNTICISMEYQPDAHILHKVCNLFAESQKHDNSGVCYTFTRLRFTLLVSEFIKRKFTIEEQ